MGKKYIATIMDRHYLGDSTFIFSVNHAAIGEINEESELFTDRNGNEYGPMLSPLMLGSEIASAFANVTPLSELPKSLNMPLREAISEYEFLCRQNIYYVGRHSNGEVFCLVFNVDSLRNSAEKAKNHFKEVTERPASEIPEVEKPPTVEERVEVEEDALDQLMEEVVMGKYSLKELKSIVAELKENGEHLQTTIDSIELQIEASEKGESAVELPKDEEVKKKKEEKKEPEMTEEEALAFLEKWSKERDFARIRKIDIDDLFKKVTKTLIAQDEPARRVITEIARKEMDDRKKRQGILLTGATGVGKTELMRLIAKHLDKPFKKIDSTQITVPGYVGRDIEEELWDLYVKCGKDKARAEEAIIFFDEIDKKGSDKKSDVSGQGVLNVLLPFVEGAVYDACPDMRTKKQSVQIDTSNMTIIFGGAFSDVYKNLKENNGIGFGQEIHSKEKPKYRKATTQDFVDRGMMTDEFMGRVTVVKLNDLDVEDIKRIMLESDESAMKIQKEIFEQLGVTLTFTDSFTQSVAEKAVEKKSGARGINSIIDECTWKAFDKVYSNPGEYQEVIVDEKTIEDAESFQLVKKRGN